MSCMRRELTAVCTDVSSGEVTRPPHLLCLTMQEVAHNIMSHRRAVSFSLTSGVRVHPTIILLGSHEVDCHRISGTTSRSYRCF